VVEVVPCEQSSLLFVDDRVRGGVCVLDMCVCVCDGVCAV